MKAMPLLVQVRSASAVNSRRSASAVNSRRSASAVNSRPWQLAGARAHQEISARARRRRVKAYLRHPHGLR